jgi:glycosyltransferase involved in cell wall biosynthesis
VVVPCRPIVSGRLGRAGASSRDLRPYDRDVPGPEISVVIPVRDGARTLPALFAALEAQTLARERFEVVVVDNGSRDATAAIARDRRAVVTDEAQPNRARARNRGVEVALAPRIAFTDADCAPAPGWLAALSECLAGAPLVAGAVELVTGEPPNRWEELERLWRFRQRDAVAQGWAATANLGVRRDAFIAAAGFDPAYRHIGEDVDFCLRARAAGFTLAWCPGAVVRHDAEATAVAVLRRGVIHGYSSNQHAQRWDGAYGWRHWRHPRPAVAGDWALRRFGDVAAERRELLGPARAEYAARVLGSAWAELRRAR